MIRFVYVILLALCAHSAYAQAPVPLPHANPQPEEHFATSVARCDGYSAVGCPQCGASGKVFLYDDDGVQTRTITYSGQGTNARFGESVSMSDNCDVLAIGAPGDDSFATDAGRVFVYTRTQGVYTLRTAFTHSTANPQDEWGSAVHVSPSGNTIALSASGYGTYYAGRTVVRSGSLWTTSKEVVYSSADPLDYAGYHIALDDDTLVATAALDEHEDSLGSLYVFKRHHGGTNMWGEVLRTGIPGTFQIGHDITLLGRWVFLGAPYDGAFPGQGSVYVLRLSQAGNTATVMQRVRAPQPQDDGGFGVSLDVSGDTLFVGEPGRIRNGLWGIGSMHEFRRIGNSWVHLHEYASSGVFEGDFFGWQAAGFGGLVLSGAPYADANGEDAGGADFYTLPTIFVDSFESGSHAAWRLVTE